MEKTEWKKHRFSFGCQHFSLGFVYGFVCVRVCVFVHTKMYLAIEIDWGGGSGRTQCCGTIKEHVNKIWKLPWIAWQKGTTRTQTHRIHKQANVILWLDEWISRMLSSLSCVFFLSLSLHCKWRGGGRFGWAVIKNYCGFKRGFVNWIWVKFFNFSKNHLL